MQNELYVENNVLNLEDFISLKDEKEVSKVVYWDWAEETGDTEEEIYENDLLDSEFMGKKLEMAISVTGRQAMKEPFYYVAKYGDSVNYTLKNGEQIKGVVINKFADTVEIMPVNDEQKPITIGSVKLGASQYASKEARINEIVSSYMSAIKKINEAAKEYPKATRALNVQDLNRLYKYTPNIKLYEKRYDANTENGGDLRFIVDERTIVNDNIKAISLVRKDGTKVKVGDTISINETIGSTTIESITIKLIEGANTNANYFYYINGKSPQQPCWLASRYISLGDSSCCYSVFVWEHAVNVATNDYRLYYSTGTLVPYYKVRPVVPVVPIVSPSDVIQEKDETSSDKTIWNIIE